MLSTSPYLHILRPSPTTAEFTVSTLPPFTLPVRIVLYLVNSISILLGISILLLVYSKWTLSPFSTRISQYTSVPSLLSEDIIWFVVAQLLQSPPGRLALSVADETPAWLLVPLAIAGLYVILLRIHTEERLLVLRGLGIQTSSTPYTVLGSPVTRFIPTEKIQDVLINEAFWGFEVRYFLIIIVDGEEDLVVVFPKLMSRRQVVEKVWRGVRGCLYGEQRDGKV